MPPKRLFPSTASAAAVPTGLLASCMPTDRSAGARSPCPATTATDILGQHEHPISSSDIAAISASFNVCNYSLGSATESTPCYVDASSSLLCKQTDTLPTCAFVCSSVEQEADAELQDTRTTLIEPMLSHALSINICALKLNLHYVCYRRCYRKHLCC